MSTGRTGSSVIGILAVLGLGVSLWRRRRTNLAS
jgi:MYXO-CTERM domain-containing protein